MWYKRALVAYFLYPNIWPISTKHQSKKKEIEINFSDRNLLDLTYYDTYFFGGPSEKTDYLMNDETTTTKLCFLYQN